MYDFILETADFSPLSVASIALYGHNAATYAHINRPHVFFPLRTLVSLLVRITLYTSEGTKRKTLREKRYVWSDGVR